MENIEDIIELRDIIQNQILKDKVIKEQLDKEKNKEKDNIIKLQNDIDLYEKKKLLLKEASKTARDYSKQMFESVSTEALKTVLSDNLSVVIQFDELKGNPTANFYVKAKYEDYDVEVNPTEEDGGGVADVISLASLIAMNSFLTEENSAPFILDEPTKYVSKGNAKDVSVFINNISHSMNKQFFVVTHDGVSGEIADKSYNIKLDKNGISIVTDITEKKETN